MSKVEETKTHDDYINEIKGLIKDGYLSEENLAPIKCTYCESKNLKNNNHSFDETILVEYERICKDCGKFAGRWTYGVWETI